MSNLGFSVYLSLYDETQKYLKKGRGEFIFTSTHISEEFNDDYPKRIEAMLLDLKKRGYRLLCDVSKKTLTQFKVNDIVEFKKKFDIDIIRIDYGYDLEELKKLAKQTNICLNASTISEAEIIELLKINPNILFLHNFYPRPETGLDNETFDLMNQKILKHNGKVGAFIPGNKILRGPLYKGLPTLEDDRYLNPYVAYLEMKKIHNIDTIFVGDPLIDEKSLEYIRVFEDEHIICLPIICSDDFKFLNKTFTIRVDSPKSLKRLQESREYSTIGERIEPENCVDRKKGSITMDNYLYNRYSGEIMIIAEDKPADSNVNVIARIKDDYLDLLKVITNGSKIRFVK